MTRHRSVWIIAMLLVAGCAGESVSWQGRVSEENGVVRVENPVEPLAAPGAVTADLLWSSTGPSAGDIWEAPRQLHVGNDLIFLTDRQAGKIHRVALNGGLLSSFGEPGQGPGQYGRLIDAIPGSAGLFVVDAGNGRVELLDAQGEILESVPLDQYVFAAVPLGQESVAVFGSLGGEERWERITATGGREPIRFPELERTEEGEPPPSRVVSWGDRPVQLEHTVPRVWVYSPAGELERVIHIPLPPEITSEGELREMVQEIADLLAGDGVPAGVIQQQTDEMKARLRIKSRFRDLCFDDEAGLMAILEQNPEDFGAGPATLHLLTSEGIYLAVLPFQEAWADFDLRGGILYALARDPLTDLVALQVYRLRIPGSLMDRGRALGVRGP